MKRCMKCLTPDSYPGTSFNSEGVCNYCLEYEKTYSDWDTLKHSRREQFEKLLEFARRRSKKYDVMVPLSGGKDSTYALYLATKKYRLKTLCFNFDNGFKSEVAHENIKSAVEASGADLIVVKPNEQLMMKLYRHFFKHTGMFCPVCMRGIYASSFSIRRLFEIPLVLNGTSRRTEETLVPEIFQAGELLFFNNVLKKFPFNDDIRFLYSEKTLKEKFFRIIYLLSKGKFILGSIDIPLPDFFDWNYDDIYRTITDEMGWKSLPDRDEHVDCLSDPTVHYLRQVRCHDLTPNTLRYSAEIRSGQMDRSKALEFVEEEMQKGIDHKYIEYFINKLEITSDDFESYMTDNMRHMAFQKEDESFSIKKVVRKLLKL